MVYEIGYSTLEMFCQILVSRCHQTWLDLPAMLDDTATVYHLSINIPNRFL